MPDLGYAYATERLQHQFQSYITTVSRVLNQPQCKWLANLLTEIRMVRMDRTYSNGSVLGNERTLNK